ncbi:FG-GAP repeat domain-containing protein [Microbispora siamensis]
MNAKKILCSVASLALAASLAGTPATASAAAPALKNYDFNGDGYNDVAIQGARVLYGGPNGLSKNNTVLLTPPADCATSSYKCNDLGLHLAAADVDKDGRTDLIAAGQWYAVVNSWTSTGIAQSTRRLPYTGYTGWGASAADKMQAGEFDGQPGVDIVKFMWKDQWFGSETLGGWYSGAQQGTYQYLPYNLDGTSTVVDDHDTAAGDVNGDGKTELAYLSGDSNGYSYELSVMYPPHTSPLRRALLGSKAACDSGGAACVNWDTRIAMADVNGDGYDDLAALTGTDKTLQVWYGSSNGLPATPSFSSRALTWLTADQMVDARLAAGDVNGDGAAEIAIGLPQTTFSGKTYAGMVAVIPGSTGGPVLTGTQFLTQDHLGSTPTPTAPVVDPLGTKSVAYDYFGGALSIIDVTGDGKGEVLVGVRGKNSDAGMLAVLRGSATGISATNAQVINAGDLGITGATRWPRFILH